MPDKRKHQNNKIDLFVRPLLVLHVGSHFAESAAISAILVLMKPKLCEVVNIEAVSLLRFW